ncbi:MAG TPA: hypothetical protein VF777_04715 [Phycisphaerales bacterium]
MRYRNRTPAWMVWVLRLAALYNFGWAVFMVALPHAWWDWLGLVRPNYEFLWPGMGALIGFLGLGYLIASTDPASHRGLVYVGLGTKVLGFVGVLQNVYVMKIMPEAFAAAAIVNDLIWIVPIFLIARHGWIESGRCGV